ncbi:MAG: hypothetical protein AAGK04_09795, partial [Planctomycetota bacterium]
TISLRYGKVVGEAFGIDPVFGAMLNPTGGLVGPGNTSIRTSDESCIGYHGTVHDAAGYLKNYHKTGPGYDYRGDGWLPTDWPIAGQISGIDYWCNQNPSTKQSATEIGGEVIEAGVEAARSTAAAAVKAVKETGESIRDALESGYESFSDWTADVFESDTDDTEAPGDDQTSPTDAAGRVVDESSRAAKSAATAAAETVAKMQEEVADAATDAIDSVVNDRSSISDAAADAMSYVADLFD